MEYLSDTYAGSLIEEGKAEGIEKVAINMLSNFTDEQIVMATELSLEEVVKIREENMEYLSDAYAGRVRAEGKAEGKAEVAVNMLSDYTDEQIAKVSKLSLEYVAKIREENMVRS